MRSGLDGEISLYEFGSLLHADQPQVTTLIGVVPRGLRIETTAIVFDGNSQVVFVLCEVQPDVLGVGMLSSIVDGFLKDYESRGFDLLA